MSLINDALKRAQDTQPKSPAADSPELRFAETTSRSGGVDIVMPLVTVVIRVIPSRPPQNFLLGCLTIHRTTTS